jgi:hypothetical protein
MRWKIGQAHDQERADHVADIGALKYAAVTCTEYKGALGALNDALCETWY